MLKMKGSVASFLALVAILCAPAHAYRRPNVPASSDGFNVSLCPNSSATPFFAVLDGIQSAPSSCTPNSDKSHPNPPQPNYPNRVVTLTGQGFTVTITPALWSDGSTDSALKQGSSKATVFTVQFSGPGLTLVSLISGTRLNNPNYVVPPSGFPANPCPIPCVDLAHTFVDASGDYAAQEPTPIVLADGQTTRWDFYQFADGDSTVLVADGFPSEFAKIDSLPNSNLLTPTSFSTNNFLAIVKDASNTTLTAGGLKLKSYPAATNDIITKATKVGQLPWQNIVDTSATNPQEIISGLGAGGMIMPQGDPVPVDPQIQDRGWKCSKSWAAGSSVFRSVWYQFTPTVSQNYDIRTSNSRYDTGIYVFTGSESSPNTIDCNDDGVVLNFNEKSSEVMFSAKAGTPYYVMVSEVPPPVGTSASDGTTPEAAPLANDATLDISVSVASGLVLKPSVCYNFPDTAPGSNSQTQIQVTNTSLSTVDIGSIQLRGGGASNFAALNGCGASVAAGKSCTITMEFKPTAMGDKAASMTVNVTGGVTPPPVNFFGCGGTSKTCVTPPPDCLPLN